MEDRIVSEEMVMHVVEAIRESGAIQAALDEAKEFVGRGLEALHQFPASEERDALEELARFVVDRQI